MKKEIFDKNPILKMSFDFALMVMSYCDVLNENKRFVLAKQLLRSGTSIGANAMEAKMQKAKLTLFIK